MKLESDFLEDLAKRFDEIKKKGFIQSNRQHNTGIGKTFEDLLEKKEDNKAIADFGDIEIKTHRESSQSLITLFTKSPNYPQKANSILRERFGYPSPEHNDLKILHTTLRSNTYSNVKDTYFFTFQVDREHQEIKILVVDKENNILSDNTVYSFSIIKQAIEKKIKKIAYITAETYYDENKIEYFRFLELVLFYNPTFENFITLLEKGSIAIDIRIGVYKSSPKYGKTHDHGTAFRIFYEDFEKLFTKATL